MDRAEEVSSRRITVRFPQQLHESVKQLAGIRGVSVSGFVRTACEIHLRQSLVQELAAMQLPVSDVRPKKEQSSLST